WAVGSSTTAYVQVFYFKLTTSISTTTFQLSGSGAAYAAIQCDTAAGVNAVGKDGQSSATTSSGGVITAGSITPSITGDYLFCGAASQGSSTLSTGSGFTAGASPATNLFNEYQVLSSASSITPTMDISGGTYAGMVCSAFRPLESFTASPSESNVASDTISRLAAFGRSDSETNTASDTLARSGVFSRTDSESNTASDSL